MPALNPGHMWLVLLLLLAVLIVRGPGRLPEVGAGLGRAIRSFHAARNDEDEAVTNPQPEAPELPPAA